MSAPINLAGRSFGRLRAVSLHPERTGDGRRQWSCECECGGKVLVGSGSLLGGHTRSCGCLTRDRLRPFAFKKREARRAHNETRRITDGRGEWLSPREATRYVTASAKTLREWETRCPLLDGEGIQAKKMPTAYGRRITYYLREDLDRVIEARARRRPVPEYHGLVHIDDATRELGVSPMTLWRELAARGERTQRKGGKSADGRPLPRRYLRRSVLDAIKQERASAAVPAECMTIAEAANALGLKTVSVHALIRRGELRRGEIKRTPTAYRRGGRGATLRFPRQKMLLDRAEVMRLKARREGLPVEPTVPPPPAEPPGKSKRPTGRPRGTTDKRTADRNRRLIDAWESDEYPTIKALARAFSVSPSRASRIVNGKA